MEQMFFFWIIHAMAIIVAVDVIRTPNSTKTGVTRAQNTIVLNVVAFMCSIGFVFLYDENLVGFSAKETIVVLLGGICAGITLFGNLIMALNGADE